MNMGLYDGFPQYNWQQGLAAPTPWKPQSQITPPMGGAGQFNYGGAGMAQPPVPMPAQSIGMAPQNMGQPNFGQPQPNQVGSLQALWQNSLGQNPQLRAAFAQTPALQQFQRQSSGLGSLLGLVGGGISG